MASRAILVLGLLALCAGLARANPCGPSFNFFPTADEIGEPQIVNNKTCKGSTVCNFPSVWQKANQTVYMSKLGTDLENGLLKVAYKQYGNERPRLFFTPVSEFLSEGASVNPECAASKVHAPTTRKLQAEARKHQNSDVTYTVVSPGTWSYSVSYDGAAPVKGQKIAGRSGQLDPIILSKDGEHCANITLTVENFKISPSLPGFPTKLSSTQAVCWFRLSTQAAAKFEFDMCSTKYFTVNVSNIAPLAQQLTQNGQSLDDRGKPAMLFRPVIHLFGRKNRTLDGQVLQELEYDNMNNPINFINKYIVLPSNLTSADTLSFVLDEDQLDEGYYKLSAKVALISKFPDLVDLEGENTIVQIDSYGEDVRGFAEFSAVTVVEENDMVGVQKSKTTISQITSDKIDRSIQSGDVITFFWKFAGIGSERCFHDDVEIPNCSSGVFVQANDVTHEDTMHKFRVEFTDVCGNTKDAEYTYTQQGVQAVSKVDYNPIGSDVMSEEETNVPQRQAQNSAAAAGPAGFLATLGMGLISFMLMAAAVL